MNLFDALYHGLTAQLGRKIVELEGPIVAGAMKSHEDYKRQTGQIAGLKDARQMLANEYRRLTQPAEKKPASDQPEET